jgi:hypothetical protein
MPNMRHHFNALLAKIEPPDARRALVAERCGDVRRFLQDHEFATVAPHSRLAGSYARWTAIELIPDVDVLLFLGEGELDRTPNAVLRELHGVLQDYPGGTIDTRGQRRSVRLSLPDDGVHLDLVPAVAENGLDTALRVPDRPQAEWILSDPFGYAARLSALNQAHGGKLVPLAKLFKAWRDEQMARRRPKSYVLEVMLLYAVEEGKLTLCDRPVADIVHDAFAHITDKYAALMDEGTESPRIRDPQVPGTFITKGWDREHFETFMRRAREARRAAARALDADDEAASAEWARVFGSRWPTAEEVKQAARAEAATVRPGGSVVASTGRVISATGATVATRPTTYHGEAR